MMTEMNLEGHAPSQKEALESPSQSGEIATSLEQVADLEDITHPEYPFSTICAIELMCNHSDLFNRIPHLKRTLLLDAIAAFGEQESVESDVDLRRVNSTLMSEKATPDIFKSIYYHYLHLNNISRTTKTVEGMKLLIQLTSKLLKKANRKPVMFFRRMMLREHSMPKDGEYGRHTIDSTGGVYGEAIDLTNIEGDAGSFLRLGLAKGILELLHNQAKLAGVEPMSTQLKRNSRRPNRSAAANLLTYIEAHGWDSLLQQPAPDLNSNPETRKASSNIRSHSHDVTTKIDDKTQSSNHVAEAAGPQGASNKGVLGNMVDRVRKLVSHQPSGLVGFSELDLAQQGLDAISVRIISKDGSVFADITAKDALSISGFELERMISAPSHYPNISWQRVIEMDSAEDEDNWPLFVLSTSETPPNAFTRDAGIYKYRGARGRAMLHLHFAKYATAHSSHQKQNLFAWSGHWRINGATQNEFVRVIKRTFKAEIQKTDRATLKPSSAAQSVGIDAFSLYPPLPSKNFAYREVVPSGREVDRILLGENVVPEPSPELTKARLESLGLTDLELRERVDDTRLQQNVELINKYWNQPIVADLFELIDYGSDQKIDQNDVSHQFTDAKAEQAFAFRFSLDRSIAQKHPEIATLQKTVDRTKTRFPEITIHDLPAMEKEREKVKKEIRNFLSPRISKLHILSILAGMDGSSGYCVIPKPQEQNGLGIALAGTLADQIKVKIEHYLARVRSNGLGSAAKIGLEYSDVRSLLSVLLSTSLDQTYTRLGISPLAVLDDMTAEYTDLTEHLAGISTPELKEKTFLVTQLSELSDDEALTPESESDWFNTALSGRRDTTVRSWGIKGRHQAWRMNFNDPGFFEKVDFTKLSQFMIRDTALTFSSWTRQNNQDLQDGFSKDDEVTLNASDTVFFANAAYSLWNIRENKEARHAVSMGTKVANMFETKKKQIPDVELPNALKLDEFMKLVQGMSKEQLMKLFPETTTMNTADIRRNLLHGLKVLMVTAIRTKMAETNQLAEEFTSEVARLARLDNFIHLVHSYSANRFHESFEETQGMDLEAIRAMYTENYFALEQQGLLVINPQSNFKLSAVDVHTIMLANVADSQRYTSNRLQYELALTIPVQKESRDDNKLSESS